MSKLLLKHKYLIALFISMGILSFSVCHASAMPQSMDGMDCTVQTICKTCPVPVVSASPDLSRLLTQIEILPQKISRLPDPLQGSLYHPPR